VLLDLAIVLEDGIAAPHLPAPERIAMRHILNETLPEFAALASEPAASFPRANP
jgi:hypothetical protein